MSSIDMEELAKRLQVLEDIEAIKKMKAAFHGLCDEGYKDLDTIMDFFVEDGVWNGESFGTYEGRAAIRTFFASAPKMLPFVRHQIVNPIIEVDGDTAAGQWYLLQPCTMAGDGGDDGEQAVWGSAKYNETYVKVNGHWKFRRLGVTLGFWTPYEQGWAKQWMIRD